VNATDTPIVVGVDESEEAARALRWAAAQATGEHRPVRAVYAWTVPPGWGPDTADLRRSGAIIRTPAPLEPDPAWVEQQADILAALQSEADQTLERAVHAALGDVPGDVDLRLEAVRGHARDVLVDESRHAHLLVVGSRHHTRTSAGLLGSVSHHCCLHAGCPVVVIPVAAEVPATADR